MTDLSGSVDSATSFGGMPRSASEVVRQQETCHKQVAMLQLESISGINSHVATEGDGFLAVCVCTGEGGISFKSRPSQRAQSFFFIIIFFKIGVK